MGQCVSATQYIVEERFLKEKNFHPLQVVFGHFFLFIEVRANFQWVMCPLLLCFGRISVVFDISFRRERSCNLPWYFDDLSRRFNVNIFWSKKLCKASIKSTISRFFWVKSVPSLTSIDLISSHIKTQIAKCV